MVQLKHFLLKKILILLQWNFLVIGDLVIFQVFQNLTGESNWLCWLLILLVSDSMDYDVTLKSGKN